MSLTVTITGTRSTDHRDPGWYADRFADYLRPFTGNQAHFYIGGANGIDTLSLLWLAENAATGITVVVPGTLDQQPAAARQAIERSRDRIAEVVELRAEQLRAPAYHARNQWMVDRSDLVIGFPHADTDHQASGTWQTINYSARTGKARLIVPV